MGRVFKPSYTKSDGNGGRIRVRVSYWYIEYLDEFGEARREKVSTNKQIAESALARRQELAERRKFGLPDPAAEAVLRNRPIRELVAEYLTELTNKGRAASYRAEVARQLDTLIDGCQWHMWSDVKRPGLLAHLAARMADEEDDISPATANGYLRAAKGFANWYAEQLESRSPLAGIEPFNEQVDRRRSRRVLTDDELIRLCSRAPKPRAAKVEGVVNGRDRSALYRVAACTGLRASELASLTPEHFSLDAVPPVVTVEAKDAKGRRVEPIPIHDQLLEFLRTWLPTHSPASASGRASGPSTGDR